MAAKKNRKTPTKSRKKAPKGAASRAATRSTSRKKAAARPKKAAKPRARAAAKPKKRVAKAAKRSTPKRSAAKARKAVKRAAPKRKAAARKPTKRPAAKRRVEKVARRRPAKAAKRRVERVAKRRPLKERAEKARKPAVAKKAKSPEREKKLAPAREPTKKVAPEKVEKAEKKKRPVEAVEAARKPASPLEREKQREKPVAPSGKEPPVAKEKLAPAKEKLVGKDKLAPSKEKLAPAKEKLGPSKDKPLAKDKLVSSKDKPLAKDKGGVKQRLVSPPREPRILPVREAPRLVTLPIPVLQQLKRPSIEERAASIETRLAAASEDFRKRYEESLDMSWIYHDSALEGVVYTYDELRTALSGNLPPVTDSSLQPTYDDIRRHKEAIGFIREYGLNKKMPVTLDVIKKIYLILHPEEGDVKAVKYRKDIPQHRLYFHEYAPPDKIAYKVRQIVDWLNDPETRKTRNGIRIAARAHYDLLRVYPFPVDSGKTARLFMNLLLIRSGLPPAIIHSTERQRYYEALKGSATTVLQMVQEAVENALASVEKLLDEYETRKRAFVS